MDPRLNKINRTLIRYSTGDLGCRMKVSENFDALDAIIAGINMVGEELQSTTISRNYFNDIFNSVSDIAIVINHKGRILDVNTSTSTQLGYTKQTLLQKHIDILQREGQKSLLAQINAYIKDCNNPASFMAWLQSKDNKRIPVTIVVTTLHSKQERKKHGNILLMIRDISAQLNNENLVIRTIIDTQEQERTRLAKDLHDSMGQQLSAIKFFISTSAAMAASNDQQELLEKSSSALTRLLADMRNICFNLAPRTLDEYGLQKAVKELCSQIDTNKKIQFKLKTCDNFPALEKSVEIDVFRIIQEFANNAIKHSKCTIISIAFSVNDKIATIILKDNGIGFDINDLKKHAGMGLQNVASRARSHSILLDIQSKPGKGTKYKLEKLIA